MDRPEEILTALKRNFRENRLHHAYIFSGAAGTGKFPTVLNFAAFLFSQQNGDEAGARARIDRGGHPDLVVIEAKEGTITVDDVRELPRIVAYAPLEGARRVVAICGAGDMNAQAANAILKLLEEPPPHTIFFLLVADAGLLLQTIRSRCQTLRFFPLSEEKMLARLAPAAKEAVPAVRWAEGALERAQAFLHDEGLRETRQSARRALLELWRANPRIPSESLRILETFGSAEHAAVALDTWYSLVRDMAILLAGEKSIGLYHEDARSELASLADSILQRSQNKVALNDITAELAGKCASLHRLRVGFNFHVNQKLALDQVLAELQLFSVGKIGQAL